VDGLEDRIGLRCHLLMENSYGVRQFAKVYTVYISINMKRLTVSNEHVNISYALRYVLDLCIIYGRRRLLLLSLTNSNTLFIF
jgi:hypothetical protein